MSRNTGSFLLGAIIGGTAGAVRHYFTKIGSRVP